MNDTPTRDESARNEEAPPSSAPPTPEALPSPGAMLRETREASGMSIEALAEAAKLSASIIASLEADDFSRLNEPVYVRGYYRKCALILGVEAERLTRAYDAKAKPQAPPLPSQIPLVAGGGSGILQRLLRALLILLLLALLVGGGLWLFQSSPLEPGTDNDFGATGESSSIPRESAPPPGESASARAAERAEPEPATAPAGEETPAAEAPAATPAGSGAELRIQAREESWLRVQDARGNNIANELLPAGETRSYNQPPPLEVFLGNAPGVEVRWRGERVDLAPRTRQNNTALVRVE